jgi:hypothetical protein
LHWFEHVAVIQAHGEELTMIIIEVFERRFQPRAPPESEVSSGTLAL